jgi:Tfp pilus assembly protein FimT
MEIMLVLAVLVSITALVLPALHGPMEDQRLLKSAELIRAQWTRARVTAMKTGQMHVFRYVTTSAEYAVEPWSGELNSLEASIDQPTAELVPIAQTSNVPRLLGIRGRQLPDGMKFFSGETQMDARLAMSGGDTATATLGNTLEAPPIVFYPDGSTSDAKLVLTNDRAFVELRLRGLTGMVRVSGLRTAEELSAQGEFSP